MASVQASKDQQAKALVAAAKKYKIPLGVLVGVYGIETGWGSNVATSSAGAQGAFEFIPGTAHSYNYPLTNNVDAATFQAQADAAAHYLSDLSHQHGGNWDAALKAYSGGGYGLDQVKAKSSTQFTDIGLATSLNNLVGVNGWEQFPGVKNAVDAVSSAANTAGDVGSAVGSIASLLTSAQFWIRLGEAIAGVILIAMGLRSLTGSTTTPVTVVKGAIA